MGTWPKDKHLKKLGTWNLLQAESGFEAGAMAVLTRNEGWSKEELRCVWAEATETGVIPCGFSAGYVDKAVPFVHMF
ncbi:hypothetical protein VTN77DRAFT_7853 [Rasamsonia byssochlamydoides]|uniref:uncharacterized protein n=1 Tax=Rasamsonia byssochlamydoides TaxID=89139 RepID=UPI003743B0EA